MDGSKRLISLRALQFLNTISNMDVKELDPISNHSTHESFFCFCHLISTCLFSSERWDSRIFPEFFPFISTPFLVKKNGCLGGTGGWRSHREVDAATSLVQWEGRSYRRLGSVGRWQGWCVWCAGKQHDMPRA